MKDRYAGRKPVSESQEDCGRTNIVKHILELSALDCPFLGHIAHPAKECSLRKSVRQSMLMDLWMQTQIQRRVGARLVTSGTKQNQDQVNQTVGRPDDHSTVRSSSVFGQRQ